jgi:hypothetical protein
MKKSPRMQKTLSWGRAGLAAAGLATGAYLTLGASVQAADWKENAISPVTNPVFFEDPQINTEIRPIFAWHKVSDDLGVGEGDAQLYAIQARWAVTDRLAIIAVKDGWLNIDTPGYQDEGWADISAGVKYAIIDDKDAEFIVTPGVTLEMPTGNDEVFQGNGDSTVNPFVSVGKGFGNLRLLGNVGAIIPFDGNEETCQVRYSAQIDYTTCRWFVPFVAWNAFTVLSEGDGLATDFEGFDLFNFGSQHAEGYTQSVVGAGFRSFLTSKVQLGFAYEIPISSPEGVFDERFTVDLIWRF